MEQKNDKPLYPIFSSKVANRLWKMGFKYVKIKPNAKHPQFDVFMYEDTPPLSAAYQELFANSMI